MIKKETLQTLRNAGNRSKTTFNASMTIIPATMAFVVAIAGIIFPAIAENINLKQNYEITAVNFIEI